MWRRALRCGRMGSAGAGRSQALLGVLGWAPLTVGWVVGGRGWSFRVHSCWGGCGGKNRGGGFASPRCHAAGGSVCAPHLAPHGPRQAFLSYSVKEARGWFVPGHPGEWRCWDSSPGPTAFSFSTRLDGALGAGLDLQAWPACPACPPPFSEKPASQEARGVPWVRPSCCRLCAGRSGRGRVTTVTLTCALALPRGQRGAG